MNSGIVDNLLKVYGAFLADVPAKAQGCAGRAPMFSPLFRQAT
jgi:hypothetical protein